MIKIVLRADGPFMGMSNVEPMAFDESATEKDFSGAAWDFAVANAENYGYYITEDEDELEDDCYITSDQIEGWWEHFDAEIHDGLDITEDDFNV